MQGFALKSPKATVILEILAAPDSRVEAGAPLIRLPDWEEQKVVSEIQRRIEENRVKALEVADGSFASAKIAALAEVAASKVAGAEAASTRLKATQAGYEVGTRTSVDVLEASSTFVHAGLSSLQAAVEGEIFVRHVGDARVVYQRLERLLNAELLYVQRCIDRLLIRAPRAGVFRCSVREGTPVRLGHLLGVVN